MGRIPDLIRDALGLIGIGSVTFGAWCVYHPAGYIVGGAFLLGWSVYNDWAAN